MNKHLKTLVAGAAIAAGLAAAPALYAEDYLSMPHGSMIDQGGMRGMMGGVTSDMMNTNRVVADADKLQVRLLLNAVAALEGAAGLVGMTA